MKHNLICWQAMCIILMSLKEQKRQKVQQKKTDIDYEKNIIDGQKITTIPNQTFFLVKVSVFYSLEHGVHNGLIQ